MDSAEYWTGGDTEVSVKEKALTGGCSASEGGDGNGNRADDPFDEL